jgi:hypothetical protein
LLRRDIWPSTPQEANDRYGDRFDIVLLDLAAASSSSSATTGRGCECVIGSTLRPIDCQEP